MKTYKKGYLVTNFWPYYRKKHLTQATRITEPFAVETREGKLICQNGYLAVDSKGFPYPIDKEEFESIYEKVKNATRIEQRRGATRARSEA